MDGPDRDPPDDKFVDLLAEWDEALAVGGVATPVDTSATPSELCARLERGLTCVQLLRQFAPMRPVETETPARLGRFEIVRELGRGGFGVVFLAHDPRLGREVALKVPRADGLVTQALRDRLRTEARAAAALDHPNIVPVHEAGDVGPVTYIASAYCPGPTLAAWLKDRTEPVPFAQAAELVATLAVAVEHAHQRGVLHRDLKPGNVLLVSRDALAVRAASPPGDVETAPGSDRLPRSAGASRLTDVPKITDFGLAKVIADTDSTTRTGAVLGTPSYMAPEQAGGRPGAIGPQADVYSLGAIMYELLTGRPPFRGETDLDTLAQVRADDPVAPRRLRPGLSRDLETVCLKCLRKEPHKRYATAAELSADLRRYLAGEAVLARPIGPGERALKWGRRRPALTGALVVIGLLTLGGAAGGWALWRQTEGALDREQGAHADAKRGRTEAEANLAAKLVALARFEWHDDRPDLARQHLAECPPHLRDREWYRLYRACTAEVRVLPTDNEVTPAVAVSPDGRWVAAAGDSMVRVWELHGGRPVAQFPSQGRGVSGLAFTPDSARLIVLLVTPRSVAVAPHLQGWETVSWQPLAGYPRHVPLKPLSLAHGARWLAGQDPATREPVVFDLETSRGSRPGVAVGAAWNVVASSDGRRVSFADDHRHRYVWDVETGRVVQLFDPADTLVSKLAFSPDNRRMAVVCQPARGGPPILRLLDPDTGHVLWTAANFKEADVVSCLAFSPNGQSLALAVDTAISVRDAATGAEWLTLRGHRPGENEVQFIAGSRLHVLHLAFAADGRTLVSAGRDRTVRVWDVRPPHE